MKDVKIISYNVNGLRSAIKKGFIEWLSAHPADIICLQEIKAHKENVDFAAIEALGYHTYWYPAQKKGYSGVAVFTKIEPLLVTYGNSYEQSDFEGRVIRLDFPEFTLVNAYFPSGTSGEERQTYKYQWLDEFREYLQNLRKTHPNLVITGDYNIAHQEIDIHDPKGNKNSSGFLLQERDWMTNFLGLDYIDSFRFKYPEATGKYSWWSQRFPSVRLNNKGWRIDYICVTGSLKNAITDAVIYPDVKHSDHCPVYLHLHLK